MLRSHPNTQDGTRVEGTRMLDGTRMVDPIQTFWAPSSILDPTPTHWMGLIQRRMGLECLDGTSILDGTPMHWMGLESQAWD